MRQKAVRLTEPKTIHIPELGPEYENYVLPVGSYDWSKHNQEILNHPGMQISSEDRAYLSSRIGKKYRNLTVLKYAGKIDPKKYYYWCKCDCGSIKIVIASQFNHTASCGCGGTNIPTVRSVSHLYSIWNYMHQMCYLPTNRDYENTGKLGIQIYPEWRSLNWTDKSIHNSALIAFTKWAHTNGNYDELITIYGSNIKLTRRDLTKDFTPENCIFVPMADLLRDTRRTRWITAFGHCFPLVVWSEIVGIKDDTIAARIDNYGWSVEDALMTPRYKHPMDGYPPPIIPDKYLKYEYTNAKPRFDRKEG